MYMPYLILMEGSRVEYLNYSIGNAEKLELEQTPWIISAAVLQLSYVFFFPNGK